MKNQSDDRQFAKLTVSKFNVCFLEIIGLLSYHDFISYLACDSTEVRIFDQR